MTARLRQKFNVDEMVSDSIGMLGVISVNRVSYPRGADLIGIAIGNLLWQGVGKTIAQRETKPLPSIPKIFSGGVSGLETIAEDDAQAELIKGGIYTLSIMFSNIFMGEEESNPFTSSLIAGYVGGTIGGYKIRQMALNRTIKTRIKI